jgi:hypothetical protein
MLVSASILAAPGQWIPKFRPERAAVGSPEPVEASMSIGGFDQLFACRGRAGRHVVESWVFGGGAFGFRCFACSVTVSPPSQAMCRNATSRPC